MENEIRRNRRILGIKKAPCVDLHNKGHNSVGSQRKNYMVELSGIEPLTS